MIWHLDFSINHKTFDGTAFLDLIKQLVRLDRRWVPEAKGYSLYIRPTMSESSDDLLARLFSPITSVVSQHSKHHWCYSPRVGSSLRHPQSGWPVF